MAHFGIDLGLNVKPIEGLFMVGILKKKLDEKRKILFSEMKNNDGQSMKQPE